MRKRIADPTSNILNPFLVSFIIILLLSFESTASIPDAVKWSLISISLSVLPVLLITVYMVRKGRLDGILIPIRKQRTSIYLPACVFAGAGCVVLYYLEAPLILTAAFVAGLSAAVMFMCINLWWKISVHSAFIAASVTLLVILYGWTAAVATVLVPLVSWSRIELNRHSPAQVAAGILLAAVIVVAVFYPFGLV